MPRRKGKKPNWLIKNNVPTPMVNPRNEAPSVLSDAFEPDIIKIYPIAMRARPGTKTPIFMSHTTPVLQSFYQSFVK